MVPFISAVVVISISTSKPGGISTRFNLYPLVNIQETIEFSIVM